MFIFEMLVSPVKNGGVEGALRYLKRMMQIAGTLKIAKEKKHYVKKSEKRRQKADERIKKVMKYKKAIKSMNDSGR
jgi:ribosomal protein S21